MSVAESIVIFGPICQVGCFSAVGRRHRRPARRACGRGTGPPEAVRMSRRTCCAVMPVQALVDGVVLAVDRQDRDARRAGPVHHEAAGHHEHFLVGEGDGLAGVDGGEHGLEGRRCPTRRRARGRRRAASRPSRGRRRRRRSAAGRWPTAATSRASASSVAIETAAGRCFATAGARASALVAAARPTIRTRSGCASATESALVPIEPVEPRIATRIMRASRAGRRAERRRAARRCGRARRHGRE